MRILKISIFVLVLLSFALTVNSADFAGYTYNTTEGALNNTNVTIEIWNDETADPSRNVSYSALSNESGNWNITIPDSQVGSGKSVKFIPRHFNGIYVDYIGANLPPFPYDDITGGTAMLNISAINFYLREGATINVTAINSSGGAVNFSYMVKDVKLGFPIESEWQTPVYQKTIYLPADRNYSIEIFPAQAMPIYYNLNNLSAYSAPKHVDIIFNTTTQPIRVIGRFNISNGTGVFEEMNIINYLLEPGSMVFAGQAMPYNMSAWTGTNDIYNTATGEYNISLQGTAMTSKVLMFAIGKVGGDYYGGFRNISPTISGGDISGFNFTLYKLLGSAVNITLNKAISTEAGGTINVTASKTTFAFVNASNATLASATGHIELDLDYSNLDSSFPDFTWMFDVQQTNQGTFTLPLLNYSIKRLNMFTQNYAPLKLKYTAAQLDVSRVNITMRAFNPGGINSDFGGIQMKVFKSSAECDVPSPPSSCDLTGTGDYASESDFKPLNAVVSGGKISFRIKKGDIVVHYKNVDMIASGPPDAAFDESASSSTSGSELQEIWRFGSLGPEIYDSLLIGFPYSGIDDLYDLNISLPYLYDNSWNIVWNTSANGTTGINTNLTDYADYNESWFSGINCSKTDQTANCFVNTTTNLIWIKLPHFSGVGPNTKGTKTASSSSSGTGGGGGGYVKLPPKPEPKTYNVELIKGGISNQLLKGDTVAFNFKKEVHAVKINSVKQGSVGITVSSKEISFLLTTQYNTKKLDLDGDKIYDLLVTFNGATDDQANVSINMISEAIPEPKEEKGEDVVEEKVEEPVKETAPAVEEVIQKPKRNYSAVLGVITAIVVIALIALLFKGKRKK